MKRWKGEPRNHSDIKHIEGCISPNGCRCASYATLNPPETLPEYLKSESHWLDSPADREAKDQ